VTQPAAFLQGSPSFLHSR